jgi:SAM-dependent methyltransferase
MLKRCYFRALSYRFGFHPWHAASPFECRIYKAEVVESANRLRPRVVLEIGCGLGEILCRIGAARRYGFDAELGVVEAARFLHGRTCKFDVANIRDGAAIAKAIDEDVDLLVTVNWPHALEWAEYAASVRNLIGALSIRYLILDTIDPRHAGYHHYHRRKQVEELGAIISTVTSGDGVRELHVVEMTS